MRLHFRDLFIVLGLMSLFYCFLCLVGLLVGCLDGCVAEDTRCSGSRVEVCNTSGDWELEMDCSVVDPPELEWTCCVDSLDGIHSCLPADECNAADGGEGGCAVRVTRQNVLDFWEYMGDRYDFRVIQKADAEEMEAVAWALDMLGIQEKQDFMSRYTTTIGRRVYVPFEIGKGTQAQLIRQIEVGVHESQHRVQDMRDPLYKAKYLTNPTARTFFEVDAYRTNMEMHWSFYNRLLSATTLANQLKGYGVGSANIRVAKKHLTIAGKVVQRGGVVTGTSKAAIAWLNKNVKTGKLTKVFLIRV